MRVWLELFPYIRSKLILGSPQFFLRRSRIGILFNIGAKNEACLIELNASVLGRIDIARLIDHGRFIEREIDARCKL